MRLSKFIFIYFLSVCVLNAGTNSDTSMYVAVSQINPFITVSMNGIKTKIETIISYYRSNNRKEIENRNIYFQRFTIMDQEIALALREIKTLDQELFELRKNSIGK